MTSSSVDDDRHPGSGSLQYNCSLCGTHFATLSGLRRHGILHHRLSFSKTGRVHLFPDNYTYYHQFKSTKHGQQQSNQRLRQYGKQPVLCWPRMLESTLPPGIPMADPLYLDSVLPLSQSDVAEDSSPADSDLTATRATDKTALRQHHHGQGSATTDAIPRPASVRHCYVVTTPPPTEHASGRADTTDLAADPATTGPSGTRVGRDRGRGLRVGLPFDPTPQDPSPCSRQASGRLTPRPTEAHQHCQTGPPIDRFPDGDWFHILTGPDIDGVMEHITDNIDLSPDILTAHLCGQVRADDPPSQRGVFYLVRVALAMRRRTAQEAHAVWVDLRAQHR
jgi:hypothetical protein